MDDANVEMADGKFILEARDIEKRYDGTYALKGVNFGVARGKVTTLFGENGAGKSTLMKILAGIQKPTAGSLLMDGQPLELESAAHARDLGICIIHQELSLCPNLSVRDNLFMGREAVRFGNLVDYGAESRVVRALMERLQEEISPDTLVGDLRVGQQQIVEIARALSLDARVLIMDEPTSALSASEVEVLFGVIEDLTAAGVSIVYISHHLEEALQVSDRVVVLRDGEIVDRADAADVDLAWVVSRMVGRSFDLGEPPAYEDFAETVLSIEDVGVLDTASPERLCVDGLTLKVRAGEIVCLYGLMGAGRTELLEALAGRTPLARGRVLLSGQDLRGLPIDERIELGLALVPEDRQRDGLVQSLSVGQNLSLSSLSSCVKRLLINKQAERQRIARGIRDIRVKTAGPGAPIGSLSGGNQQKVVIGKMLLTDPKVLLLDEPSRGIDIGAKTEIFHLLAELAKQGLAVVYSTSEVLECLGVANRVVVMSKGKIAAEFDAADATKERIMAASGEKEMPPVSVEGVQ